MQSDGSPNTLNSQSATYPNYAKFIPGTFHAEHNMNSIIKKFIELGAPRSKLSVEISIFGYAYKRSSITYDASIGSAAQGLGSYAYNDTFLPISGKNQYPYVVLFSNNLNEKFLFLIYTTI